MGAKSKEMVIKGIPLSEGIAIGVPFYYKHSEDHIQEITLSQTQVTQEITRYRKALQKSKRDVKALKKQLEKEKMKEGAAILDAHLYLLQDSLFARQVENKILDTRKNAEFALRSLINQYKRKFRSVTDVFFRERLNDIMDISRRIQSHLKNEVKRSLSEVPKNSIVFAQEITASDPAEAKIGDVNAFVTEKGGATSHAAIVAKSKGIPFVTGIDFSCLKKHLNEEVIVDGVKGNIIINPKRQTLDHYIELKRNYHKQYQAMEKMGSLPAETLDGYQMQVTANIEMVNEIDLLHQYKGQGIGLFRSEYLFISNDRLPTEDEQFVVYKEVVKRMKNLPVVIRVFDIGGDKYLAGDQNFSQERFYFGCRAIRFLLQEKETFKAQLRAILRASAYGKVRILFPFVTGVQELIEAKKILKEVQQQLKKERKKFDEKIPLGCMVEVPAAAIISDILASECDFLSIGTNDLVQYSLVADRKKQALNNTFLPTHPSIIRLIRMIVAHANSQGVPVTVCGELASNPRFTKLLMGLGIDELSVTLRHIPLIKYMIRNTSIVDANRLAEEALRLKTASQIESFLNKEYEKIISF